MMGDMGAMGWWGPGIGGIFMVLWWGLIIVGIVALVRWLMSLSGSGNVQKDALGILKQRYARGELDRDEFEKMRRDIEQ